MKTKLLRLLTTALLCVGSIPAVFGQSDFESAKIKAVQDASAVVKSQVAEVRAKYPLADDLLIDMEKKGNNIVSMLATARTPSDLRNSMVPRLLSDHAQTFDTWCAGPTFQKAYAERAAAQNAPDVAALQKIYGQGGTAWDPWAAPTAADLDALKLTAAEKEEYGRRMDEANLERAQFEDAAAKDPKNSERWLKKAAEKGAEAERLNMQMQIANGTPPDQLQKLDHESLAKVQARQGTSRASRRAGTQQAQDAEAVLTGLISKASGTSTSTQASGTASSGISLPSNSSSSVIMRPPGSGSGPRVMPGVWDKTASGPPKLRTGSY